MTTISILVSVAGILSVTAQAETPVERGHYLVEGVLTCGNCHSPRGPGGVIDSTKLYSGGPQTWDEPTFTVRGANITPDAASGIGKWSDDDIKKALSEGIRPSGGPLAPIMPYGFYKIFTTGDLEAIVAYLRSVPAVSNAVQPPIYKAALHVDTPPGADKPMTEADLRDPVRHGFYLVTVAHCMECHTPRVNDRLDFANLGKGGQTFRGPWGETMSRNITSHPEKGIGAWSDDDIKRAITQGIRKDGSHLKPPMGFAWYARMTDADLGDIVAYLRTVPARE
ncbi:c-type cytochrome [Bradyrhizobium jicamae]|uniref:C-type cytochrome n=2 Tax=Bradyrhizobium jicamae TaxID=280332 RepID=A0ABS5FNJ1_9BRAD|nr:c-type cytochrome [Bradyrhizobium jicamae]